MAADRLQVLQFRCVGHHLNQRLPRPQLATAAGAAGIRRARESALLALHARVEGVTQEMLDGAIRAGEIVDVMSARGTRTLVPGDAVAAFTIGTLPADEESFQARLKPFRPVLEKSGHSAIAALELAKEVARETLRDGPVDIGVLSGALTRRLPELSPMCRGRCTVAHIDQDLFDMVGQAGVWRNEEVEGRRLYVAMEVSADREPARAELVRRYLQCYGPSTPGHFAEWCGIGAADARRSIEAARVTEVERGRFLLDGDVARFDAPSPVTGVRFLPPRDPYLLDRDRATLVPDREAQKRVWRSNPTDGLILADGIPVASWRTKKAGKHLEVNVQPFVKLPKQALTELRDEAEGVAALRGRTTSDVRLLTDR